MPGFLGFGGNKADTEKPSSQATAQFSPVTTRAATRADIPRLVEIENAGFSADAAYDEELVLDAEDFGDFFDDGDIVLVAEKGGQVVGYVILEVDHEDPGVPADSINIYSVATDPAPGTSTMGRHRIVRDLLNDALYVAREQGFTGIHTETSSNNCTVMGLLEHAGFERFGTYPGYYADGSDAVRLRKPLTGELPLRSVARAKREATP